MQPTPPPPWYKQFWPWVLIGIPTATIIACAITIYLAIVTADGMVVDDYYEEGKAINLSKARDKRARDMNLSAQLVRGEQNSIRVLFNQDLEVPSLIASFSHATQDDRDIKLSLQRSSSRSYDAYLPDLPPGKWYVQVSPAQGDWRLRSTAYNTQFETLHLAPSQ